MGGTRDHTSQQGSMHVSTGSLLSRAPPTHQAHNPCASLLELNFPSAARPSPKGILLRRRRICPSPRARPWRRGAGYQRVPPMGRGKAGGPHGLCGRGAAKGAGTGPRRGPDRRRPLGSTSEGLRLLASPYASYALPLAAARRACETACTAIRCHAQSFFLHVVVPAAAGVSPKELRRSCMAAPSTRLIDKQSIFLCTPCSVPKYTM